MSLSDIELIIVGQIEHGHVLAVHSLNKQPGGGKVSWKQSYWDQGNFQMNLTCTALAMTGCRSPSPALVFFRGSVRPGWKNVDSPDLVTEKNVCWQLGIFPFKIEMKSKHLRKTHISSSIPAISEHRRCVYLLQLYRIKTWSVNISLFIPKFNLIKHLKNHKFSHSNMLFWIDFTHDDLPPLGQPTPPSV